MAYRVLYLVTADWYFCSHRLSLARAVKEAGFEVTVVTQVGAHGDQIRDHGLDLVPVRFPRSARHPLLDLRLLARLPSIYARAAPHVVHHVALKPVLYGSVAASRAHVPVTVNALAGLGYAFTDGARGRRRWRRALSWPLRRALARASAWTVLQNHDDAEALAAAGIVPRQRVRIVRGSGVDLDVFTPRPEPAGTPVVVLAARMLWDKGIGEFVAAARLLAQRGCRARFVLVGGLDAENPAAIDRAQLDAWCAEGCVEWLGHRTDMPQVLADAHVVALPSYREGLPKSLLDAAAAGRALVATDVPGCREVVHPGATGLLVPPRDPGALADALDALIRDPARRRAMGAAARRLAEEEFSIARIARDTLRVYEEGLAGCPR